MFQFEPQAPEWIAVLPVMIVAIGGILGLIVEILHPKRDNNLIVVLSMVSLVIAAIVLGFQFGEQPFDTVYETITRDPFGIAIQFIVVICTALCVLFSEPYLREKRIAHGEFYPLILWSATGAMIMSMTHNLLVIFLGLEILSVALYVLAGLSRNEEKSEESAVKYFLLGAFASGFLLYGIALVYGATGSLNLDQIAFTWRHHDSTLHTFLVFGIGLILIGLGFKSSFVPFHQWTPDVYNGAPTNVTAFMATVSKIGAIAALARVLEGADALSSIWAPAMSVIAVLTMTVGNVVALRQTDVKRILGYSSIANAGYILVALIARAGHTSGTSKGEVGLGSVVFFLFSYSLATIGALTVVSLCAKNGGEKTTHTDLHGMAKRSPLAAAALVIFAASMIGLPPTAGFFAKLFVFEDAQRSGWTWLALVMAANSAVSVVYYLSIALAALTEDKSEARDSSRFQSPVVSGTYVLCAAGVVAVAIFFAPIMNWMGLNSSPSRPTVPERAHRSPLAKRMNERGKAS